jgi:hypothetical protein
VDQQFEVWQAGKATLVVTMADSSRLKIPREWTDFDGPGPRSALEADTCFSVGGLRDLLKLLVLLRGRL